MLYPRRVWNMEYETCLENNLGKDLYDKHIESTSHQEFLKPICGEETQENLDACHACDRLFVRVVCALPTAGVCPAFGLQGSFVFVHRKLWSDGDVLDPSPGERVVSRQ